MKNSKRQIAEHDADPTDVVTSQQDDGRRSKAAFVPPTLERHEDLPRLTGSEFNFST